jgi:hypothetical protein
MKMEYSDNCTQSVLNSRFPFSAYPGDFEKTISRKGYTLVCRRKITRARRKIVRGSVDWNEEEVSDGQ